jgi:glycosyltransferase involved in cell wall biosynthesis
MPKLISELSVFLPTFNEQENIKKVAESVRKHTAEIADKWELLIVDDGSKDNTHEIAEALAKLDHRVRVVTHKENLGYGATLSSGFYGSRFPWIAFIDSDDQFDFSEIRNFIEAQKSSGADLVIGYYKDRKVSVSKKITSKMWEYLVFFMFGLKVRDVDCGFKFISKKVIDSIPRLESQRGAFISSELLIKAKRKGFKIVEIPVTHYPRLKGVGTGRNLRVIIKSFMDLFRLWRKLK